jgi:Flp pilus assembly protein TadB
LTRAIDLASKRRYGSLSPELERVAIRLSWGGGLEEALKDFADRVDTKLARRTSVLISEISRSGGSIKDVLEIVSKHARELQTIEEERRSPAPQSRDAIDIKPKESATLKHTESSGTEVASGKDQWDLNSKDG